MAGANAEHGHAVPLRILLGTWAALIVLTWVTVAVTKIELGALNIVVALGVAVVKSTLVALYFMHLRWDKPFNAIIFVSALLFVGLFITLALIDTTEYQPNLIPGYAPAITDTGAPPVTDAAAAPAATPAAEAAPATEPAAAESGEGTP